MKEKVQLASARKNNKHAKLDRFSVPAVLAREATALATPNVRVCLVRRLQRRYGFPNKGSCATTVWVELVTLKATYCLEQHLLQDHVLGQCRCTQLTMSRMKPGFSGVRVSSMPGLPAGSIQEARRERDA